VKALSLWQPWATLLVNGWKGTETRSWGTPDRGWIAIAATATLPPEGRRALKQTMFQAALYHCVSSVGIGRRAEVLPGDLPYGAILGIAKIGGCRTMTAGRIAERRECEPMEHAFGDYRPGRFEWHIERAHVFIEPIPCRGGQKLWNVKGELATELEDRLVKGAMKPKEARRLCQPQPVPSLFDEPSRALEGKQ
jgi:hypothetical protein